MYVDYRLCNLFKFILKWELKNASFVPYHSEIMQQFLQSAFKPKHLTFIILRIYVHSYWRCKSYRYLCHIVPWLFINPHWLDIPIQCDRPNLCIFKVGTMGYSFNFIQTYWYSRRSWSNNEKLRRWRWRIPLLDDVPSASAGTNMLILEGSRIVLNKRTALV